MKSTLLRRGFALAALVTLTEFASAAPSNSVYVEDLTWTELRDRVAAGATTVLVPIGGTEQSGPHMALGKHNVRARVLAGRIAQGLGNALVAPVVAYVPEGAIAPPAAHMRFPGTISISDAAFESMLESTAKSFCAHGVRDVVLLGDHGGYQSDLEHVAARLAGGAKAGQGATSGCRVHALVDYYRVTQGPYIEALKARGYSTDEIGTHAGLADTSLMLAVDPSLVRQGAMSAKAGAREGVYGDPRRSSVELGQLGVDKIVETSVARIKALTAH